MANGLWPGRLRYTSFLWIPIAILSVLALVLAALHARLIFRADKDPRKDGGLSAAQLVFYAGTAPVLSILHVLSDIVYQLRTITFPPVYAVSASAVMLTVWFFVSFIWVGCEVDAYAGESGAAKALCPTYWVDHGRSDVSGGVQTAKLVIAFIILAVYIVYVGCSARAVKLMKKERLKGQRNTELSRLKVFGKSENRDSVTSA